MLSRRLCLQLSKSNVIRGGLLSSSSSSSSSLSSFSKMNQETLSPLFKPFSVSFFSTSAESSPSSSTQQQQQNTPKPKPNTTASNSTNTTINTTTTTTAAASADKKKNPPAGRVFERSRYYNNKIRNMNDPELERFVTDLYSGPCVVLKGVPLTATRGDVERYIQSKVSSGIKKIICLRNVDLQPTGIWFVSLESYEDARLCLKVPGPGDELIGVYPIKSYPRNFVGESQFKKLYYPEISESNGRAAILRTVDFFATESIIQTIFRGYELDPIEPVTTLSGCYLVKFASETEAHRAVRERDCTLLSEQSKLPCTLEIAY